MITQSSSPCPLTRDDAGAANPSAVAGAGAETTVDRIVAPASDIHAHTPGPWVVGYRGMDVGAADGKGFGYAKLFDVRGWGFLAGNGHGGLGLDAKTAYEIQQANARLCAAAPDLLAAVKEALGLAKIAETLTGCRSDDDYVWGIKEMLEAAIAKAEGRAP